MVTFCSLKQNQPDAVLHLYVYDNFNIGYEAVLKSTNFESSHCPLRHRRLSNGDVRNAVRVEESGGPAMGSTRLEPRRGGQASRTSSLKVISRPQPRSNLPSFKTLLCTPR